MKNKNKSNHKDIVIFDDAEKISDIVFRKTLIEFNFFSLEIERLIKEKCQSKSVINYMFNSLLSLKVIVLEDLKIPYHKLLNYTATFNRKLANKYEDLFFEYIDRVYGDYYE